MTDTSPAPSATGIVRQRYPLRARTLIVLRTEELSPDMRRIVVGGDELEATLPHTPMGVADHVKLVIPDETTGEVLLPEIGERGITRPEGVAIRDYTIRAFDPEARELWLDFVLHDHGPAGRWAITAKPGDRLGVMGPRGTTIYPSGYARYVLAADETALPATERWIAEAPPEAELDVFILVPDAAHERTLPSHPGLTVHWLHRDAGDDLASAIVAAVPEDDGNTYVWAAAEAGSVQPARRYLSSIGLPRHRVDVHGYWKLGEAGHQEPHGEPGDEHTHHRGGRAHREDPQTTPAAPAPVVIPEHRRHLLDEPNHGVLAVSKPDGSIIATPMWFVHQDGMILFTHTTRRGKFKALRQNPHMTLLVVSPTNPNEYLELRGELVETAPDPKGDFFATLARRYGRWDGNPPSDVEHRVILIMRIDQAHSG